MTELSKFQHLVLDYYHAHGRHDMPWRQPDAKGEFDPYKIWISEIMLQQTQVSRVIPKFESFIARFPDIHSLARAPLADILTEWVGLGYNRRAKFIWQAAQLVANELDGVFPKTLDGLVALPGIGTNTAGAIMAYAYNESVVFIETNIRTVFIYHFFADQDAVTDKELLPIITKSIPADNPREWYWALMDYGSYIKATQGNASRQSKHHVKQSAFEGSRRQLRGAIIKQLMLGDLTYAELQDMYDDNRLLSVLQDLVSEGFVTDKNNIYTLAK